MVTTIKPTAGKNHPVAPKKETSVSNAPSNGSLVDKLDGNQLVSVARVMADLGKSVVNYRIEQEKTEQAHINSRVRLEEIDKAEKASERAFKTETTRIQAQAAKDFYDHEETMEKLRQMQGESLNSIDLRQRYMTMLEQGKVTAQQFNEFITALNAGGAPTLD